MNNILEYKGYHAKITFDCESKTLHGYIDGIRDYIDFYAMIPKKLKKSSIRLSMNIWNSAKKSVKNRRKNIKEALMSGSHQIFIEK